jgi:hypothetical protein
MVTISVSDASESGASEQDVASRRFQRLERVRARQRARRRNRLILVAMLVAALTGAGVLAFTAVRGTSSEPVGDARSRQPVGTPPPATAPALPPRPATGTPSASTPAPFGAKSSTVPPPRIQMDASPAREVQSPATGVTGPSPGAPREAEADDGAAAIDWLLKTRSP